MECTQSLEYTQELNIGSDYERICPEQIGILGICGKVYPILKGPNKIGRDPQMCNIVLNTNSISKQHAVVNILSSKQFMLMDLDSTNKTKLVDKTLQPYIPHPLNNGDSVQFGDVFGIFRLLDDDDDLPMTQVINIPDTPVHTKYLSKINSATSIPESPDVSDKDDSYIISTQFKDVPKVKSSNEHFIKPSSKTISIQPVGLNKIDNIFWNSSKRSNSMNSILNNSRNSLNNCDMCINDKENKDIHEMETQIPYSTPNENPDLIFEAQTQIPYLDPPSPSNIETQIPQTECLPKVCKIYEQCDVKLALYSTTKVTPYDIDEAETQDISLCERNKETNNIAAIKENTSTHCKTIKTTQKFDDSDEELLVNDITSQSFQTDFESQCLLPKVSLSPKTSKDDSYSMKNVTDTIEKSLSQLKKRVNRIESGSSTDCEDLDMVPTQKVLEIQVENGDETDCEDILNENVIIKSETESLAINIKKKVSPGKILTTSISKEEKVCFEDMLTQIVPVEDNSCNKSQDEIEFQNQPTQLIDEVIPNNSECIEYTEQFSEEIISPFKVPLQPNNKIKIKNVSKLMSISSVDTNHDVIELDPDKYYKATQEVYDDLCSQKAVTTKPVHGSHVLSEIYFDPKGKDLIHTVQSDKSTMNFTHNKDKTLTTKKQVYDCTKDEQEHIKQYVSTLSKHQIQDVIGVNSASNTNLFTSASSNESTPKKLKPSKLMDIDLPNSQEIKASMHTTSKTLFTELSSDSGSENNSEEPYTPIVHHKKGKSKTNLKLKSEKLPTKVITRIRKATEKSENMSNNNILQNKLLSMQDDDDIDKEIITENMLRLQSKYENIKSTQVYGSKNKSIDNKSESLVKSLNESETKDLNTKNKTSRKKANNTYSMTKKKNEVKKESDKKTNRNISVRSSKTSDNLENLVNTEHNKEKKEEIKADTQRKTQRNHNKKIEKTETLSPTTNNRTTRSTRNKNIKYDETSVSAKVDKEKSGRKHRQKDMEEENSIEKVVEVRRSKRQKIVKDKKENALPKVEIKSILKRTENNESTVYDTASESDSYSNKSLKRPATDSIDAPSLKRNKISTNSCLRSTSAGPLGTHHVLFTAFSCDEIKQRLENVGAVIVTDVMQCDVVLTKQIKRTFKLLCAVGLGRPVVGPNWVQACVDTKMIVDPWLYIMKDEAAEKKIGFDLERTLRGKRNYLHGYNISSTPSVLPNVAEMKLIVECSGGKWKAEGPRWICVSSTADKALWPALKRKGAQIVSTEFILAGVFKQSANIEDNLLK